jgi:hypothetical protein
MSHFQTIIDLLPSLTNEELNQLLIRTKFLFSPIANNQSDESWVLQCICDCLSSKGVEFASVPFLLKSPDIGSFRDKLPGVLRYLEGSGLQRNERKAVLTLGIQGLYDNLVEMGMLVSVRVVLRHFHRIPSVLSKEYPGYAKAGVLHKLVQRERMNTGNGHSR